MFNYLNWQKIISFLVCNYYWPKIKDIAYCYIWNSHICKCAKASRDQYYNILKPLPICIRSCIDVILDFMIKLSPSNSYNAILIVIDQLTKKKYYIFYTTDKNSIITETTTYLLLNNICKLYDFPLLLSSNWGPQFISKVWKNFCKILSIKVNLSTVFHPKTDNKSKIAN